nr:TonB-dependent receptor plug domain-containing protein [uncultured Undibacterium sp.]
MTNNKFNMKQVKRTAVAVAVGMCFASMAYAQNADGTIFGRAKAKEQVQVVSVENGSSRTIEADKDGGFTFSKLPPGRYKVTSGGKTREVAVAIGSGTEVKFDDVATVTVTGSRTRNPIDVSSTESNTVFSLAEIQALPVGRNATAVSLLAPGTVAGDAAFGNLASFSGASVAENGYYINGFDVTNMRNFTNYASLPFDAISQQQVKTGGYGAEFGRSLGGVVSLSTKRGSNQWKGGVSAYWTPGWANAKGQTVQNRDKEAWIDKNTPSYTLFSPAENTFNNLSYNLYGGGPIIKDKLFVFGILEGRRNTTDTFGGATSQKTSAEAPNGMMKLDWQISDDHRLEFTGISNKRKTSYKIYDNLANSDKYALRHVGTPRLSSIESGGDVEILKYTGYITENLTVSAQYGRVFSLLGKVNDASDFGADCPAIYGTNGQPAYGCWNPSHFTIRDLKAPENSDTRKGKRLDFEYLAGSHTIRAGWDGQDFISTQAGSTYSGGIYYRYYTMPASRTVNGVVGAGTPGNTEFVRVRKYQTTSGSFLVKNDAMYLEDSWKVTKNVLVYGGVRSESFDNKNGDGVSFVDRKNLLAPRLGAAWDVNGDASMKVYGNFGRYYIPVASNTNIRGSSAEYLEGRFYNFTGKDPKTLAALGLGPEIGQAIISGSLKAPNPGTIADTKLRPMSQDEFILGFQKSLAKNWSMGVKGVYRKVNDGMDDYCAHTGVAKWANDNGYKDFDPDSMAGCVLMNPGRPLNIQIDAKGDGKLVAVTVPNSYLGLAKYERTYKAVELSMERPFDGKWGLSGSYVYAVGKGTAEGYVQSDLGQEDAGITQDFDFGSFTDGAYGTLPNNRTHALKMYGNYAINDNFRLGANFTLASGRSTSCIGFVPTTVPDYNGPDGTTNGGSGSYNSASSYYCLDANGKSVLGYRGNGPTMPWTKSLDLNAAYIMKLESGRTLTIQANIFNVFNTQTVTMVNQIRDYSRAESKLPTGNKLNPNYGAPSSYMGARTASISARYEF